MNSKLTSRECVDHIFRKVDKLLADGICKQCALRLVSRDHNVEYDRLLVLSLYRDVHAEQE